MNRIPMVTKNLLIINAIIYLAIVVLQSRGFISLETVLGLHFFKSDSFMLSQLITYMFVHGSFYHLFFNMFALWMFGRILEEIWGPKRFLFYYITCGIGAGIIQEIVQHIQYLSYGDSIGQLIVMNSFTVGASGAIFAILLGFGMLFPNQKLFIFPLPIPIKAKWFVIFYAVLELWLGINNSSSDDVAHFAHLGGMLFGFIIITIWRKRNNRNNGISY